MLSKYFDRSASTTVGVAAAEQRVHLLDRVRPAALRPIAVGRGVEIRLEDRLQHQLGGGLHHPVPDRRDAERPLAAAGLRDHHPSHRRWPVGLLRQVLPDPGEPLLPACRLDHRERHPVHARCALVGARQVVGVAQDVRATDLVVEQVEAERRLGLRLEIELPLKLRILSGVARLIANHRSSASLKAHQKSGPFPPPALPGLGSTTTLSDTRRPDHRRDDVGGATSVRHGSPPITRITFPTCRAHYPGGPKRVRLSVASPFHAGLPRYSGGSASTTSLSRPAQASLALRPAGSLNRPRRPLSRGFGPPGYPTKPLVSYQVYRQLPGWNLPPLVNRAVGAH